MASSKATVLSVAFVSLMLVTTLEVARKYRKSPPSASTDQPPVEGSENRITDALHQSSEISAEDVPAKTSTITVPIESTTEGDPGDSTSETSMADTTEPRQGVTETTENSEEVIKVKQVTHFEIILPDEETTLEPTDGPERQPHIVFVLADDYGHSDIGYHGSWIRTPVMDRLAAAGVKLENYYVQPICTPTRSQLLSGRYQIHTGLQHEIIYEGQPNGLPLDSPTLADKLKESGYSTHMVGKWHLGFYKQEYMPHYRGFDTFYGMLLGHGNYFTHKHGRKKNAFIDLRFNDQIIRNETGHYSTHLFTQKAIDVIKAHDKSKPLFLYLSYQAVHGPVQVPEAYERPYKHIKNKARRGYAGMVAAMDEGVGNLTEALKEAGMWDNTVFVFSSDNGGRLSKGGSNYPLRGEKHSLWEGGVKSIGFVSGGRLKQTGAVSNELIHVSDWFPTLVKLAGGHLNGTKPLDGVDQWAAINEGKPGNRHVLLHNIDPLRERRGKAKFRGTFDSSIRAAVRVGDLKLITGNPDNGQWLPPPESDSRESRRWNPNGKKNLWLFNITADPYERNDLSFRRRSDVKRMLAILQDFQDSAVEPYYPNNDPRASPTGQDGAWGPWQ